MLCGTGALADDGGLTRQRESQDRSPEPSPRGQGCECDEWRRTQQWSQQLPLMSCMHSSAMGPCPISKSQGQVLAL